MPPKRNREMRRADASLAVDSAQAKQDRAYYNAMKAEVRASSLHQLGPYLPDKVRDLYMPLVTHATEEVESFARELEVADKELARCKQALADVDAEIANLDSIKAQSPVPVCSDKHCQNTLNLHKCAQCGRDSCVMHTYECAPGHTPGTVIVRSILGEHVHAASDVPPAGFTYCVRCTFRE